MTPETIEPRETDEWRVEVVLEGDEGDVSLGDRLRSLDLDDNARRRLGGSVIVTRDGTSLFLYAWHEPSAREAERVVRDLMERDKLVGQVSLTRWHPVAEDWRPADEPLPESEAEIGAEEAARKQAAEQERAESGEYPWEVVVHLPHLRDTLSFAREVEQRGLSVKRRWRYVLVGADTEEAATELGKELEAKAPRGSHVGIRANPENIPHPVFVQLGSLEPGPMRDLGI